MHVHGDVDVGGVAPKICPDTVCVTFWLGGAGGCVGRVDTREDAIEICEKAVF